MACSTCVGKNNTNLVEPVHTAHAINQRIKQQFGVEEWNGPLQDSIAQTVLIALVVFEYSVYGIQSISADYELR